MTDKFKFELVILSILSKESFYFLNDICWGVGELNLHYVLELLGKCENSFIDFLNLHPQSITAFNQIQVFILKLYVDIRLILL